jgi:hypothetical protein
MVKRRGKQALFKQIAAIGVLRTAATTSSIGTTMKIAAAYAPATVEGASPDILPSKIKVS